MSDTFITAISTFGAAMVGAVVGGFISYLLQRQSLAAAKAQRDGDRIEIRKALGFSLVFKMIRLCSDLNTLKNSVTESLRRAKENGFSEVSFQAVMPTIPLPGPILFSAEEMALILSIDNELFNEIGPLDQLHSSTVGIFDLYNKKRNVALERLGADMNGAVGTTMLNSEQKRWFDPRAVELNQLVTVMIDRSQRDNDEALRA